MMANTPHTPDAERDRPADLLTRPGVDRRSFLRYTGATAVVGGLLLAGCKDDDPVVPPVVAPSGVKVLTNDDFGILNYAYALEQLEAAFYIKVVNESAGVLSASELDTMKAIRDHEIIHREFFKAAIPAAKRLIDLTPNFSTINFTNRTSVLGAARLFEDTGVQAYNGAGRYIADAGYLLLAGKIVSVEARHAALIRDLIAPNSFAANVAMGGVPAATNSDGLDLSKPPSVILPMVFPFIQNSSELSSLLP